MGQYLAIGLTHEIIISRKELNQKKISKEELRQEIEKSLLFDMTLYDETETEKDLVFTIKNQVYEDELIPFLKVLYPMVYEDEADGKYNDLIKQLYSTPSTEWVDLAKSNRKIAFRYDNFAESYYISFSKPFLPSICLKFNCLMLYYGNGKIVTEGIYDFLHFFKRCIHETFKDHSIVKSIQIYITG